MGLRETLERLAQPDLCGDPDLAAGFDAAVEDLFDRVAGWCASPMDDLHVTVDRYRFTLAEQGYRPREVPLLQLLTSGWSATLRPVGAQIVAAKGRVDLVNDDGVRTAMLLLDTPGVPGWCVLREPPGKAMPLDRAALADILHGLPVGPSPVVPAT